MRRTSSPAAAKTAPLPQLGVGCSATTYKHELCNRQGNALRPRRAPPPPPDIYQNTYTHGEHTFLSSTTRSLGPTLRAARAMLASWRAASSSLLSAMLSTPVGLREETAEDGAEGPCSREQRRSKMSRIMETKSVRCGGEWSTEQRG